MKQNQSFFRRAAEFAQDRGFYIILALCAVAIGISGYVLFFTGNSQDEIPQPQAAVYSNEPVELPGSGEEDETLPSVQPQTSEPEPDAQPQTSEPEPVEEKPVQQVNKPVNVPVQEPEYVLPAKGELIRGFSGQTLVYDETMADWRVHGGADFACEQGAQIFAMAGGEVSAVYTDEMWGHCVSISHQGGLVSTYCGLMERAAVEQGDTVSAGDVIGGAGGGIACESAMPMHVHIILTRDGERIDPMSLFEEQ